MALLRWIHLRKLVSIEDLIAGNDAPRSSVSAGAPRPSQAAPRTSVSAPPASRTAVPASPAPRTVAPAPAAPRTGVSGASAPRTSEPAAPSLAAQAARAAANVGAVPVSASAKAAPVASGNFKDALLAEIKKTKPGFYNIVVAQAQRIDVGGDRITFSFTPVQRALKDQFEQQKAWLESMALGIAGRKITMATAAADPSAAPDRAAAAADPTAPEKQSAEKKSALREQALADAGVQTMLEVFPAEIRDVEEM
jgi:hypothetical protein